MRVTMTQPLPPPEADGPYLYYIIQTKLVRITTEVGRITAAHSPLFERPGTLQDEPMIKPDPSGYISAETWTAFCWHFSQPPPHADGKYANYYHYAEAEDGTPLRLIHDYGANIPDPERPHVLVFVKIKPRQPDDPPLTPITKQRYIELCRAHGIGTEPDVLEISKQAFIDFICDHYIPPPPEADGPYEYYLVGRGWGPVRMVRKDGHFTHAHVAGDLPPGSLMVNLYPVPGIVMKGEDADKITKEQYLEHYRSYIEQRKISDLD